MTQEEQILELLKNIIKGTEWENKVFLVGGAVRDQIMGKPPKDLDFVVQGGISAGIDFSIWLAQKLKVYKEGSNPVVYSRYGTAKLSYSNTDMEFVAPRKEKYTPGSRKPQVTDGVLMDDSMRRDLTINSLMRSISTNQVLDLTGKGLNDIKRGIIRTPSDPKIIFKDDPLRMLRAIRFTIKYGFKISKDVLDNITKYAQWIETISKERIADELNKILVTNQPDRGIELLKITGLLKYIIPELNNTVGMTQNIHHNEDVFQHTMSVLKNTPPNLITRLMALFHDIGKITTKTTDPDGSVHFYGHENEGGNITIKIMSRLRYPSELIDAVSRGVESHMDLKYGTDNASQLSDKKLRKFSVSSGPYLQNILDLIHADNISHAEESSMPNQIPSIKQRIEKISAPTGESDVKLPINGNDILTMGIKRGPLVGQILDAIKEAWFENPNLTKDEAIEIVNKIKLENEINEIKRIMKSIIN
jgi:poly(A) polymerase